MEAIWEVHRRGRKAMNVVILAGGLGSRLQEETVSKPKPMVQIGGRPIMWHIMKNYAFYGHKNFIVALGYKADVVRNYFLSYYNFSSNLTISLATGEVQAQSNEKLDWTIHLVDTGLDTEKGGRLKRLAPLLSDGTFVMTYGDGVANVNIPELLAFHRKQAKLATVTAVRPMARFGSLTFNGDLAQTFEEKPQTGEGWINGGFFVLEPAVLDYIEGDSISFEKEPLEKLSKDGQLAAYRHEGFWQAMDTVRDRDLLERLWESSQVPWKVW